MKSGIAIVGMACRYADAKNPQQLWENALAQRRAFRRMPEERLSLTDYHSDDTSAPDRTYGTEAAVIEGYEFDRVAFRTAGSTFRSADLAHWLALDIASQALEDAGFPSGAGLPRESTGVLLGNTLTGEFSRANVMRLRWPYVRRVVEARLADEGWAPDARAAFLTRLEVLYKEPFPGVGEETLAGGLANTIAGRVCNYYDLKGGGYTLDGACASSLLALANACTNLAAGDLDVAVAGGVDLSLDPFELVGFAKTGALAKDLMRVFDRRSAGFWPGEGCGMVVLMRHEDAVEQGKRIYATIRGWGISSDGSGGMTRPEVDGQLLAVRRAYKRAGFGPESVGYFEGHGTGTLVGDATELQVLSRARQEADPSALPAAVGSIKANIGHTKAASGVAGLIKAAMAVYSQILPPTTGCEDPHPVLHEGTPALRILRTGEVWPGENPPRAGVSAMGFGGINTHVVLEGAPSSRRQSFQPEERALLNSAQDAELFLLAAGSLTELREQVERLEPVAARVSRAELADLAARLQSDLGTGAYRAALVASSPAELTSRLETLEGWLNEEVRSRLDAANGIFLGSGTSAPRVGLLFPGQGSPTHLDGGLWRRRFLAVDQLYTQAALPRDADGTHTAVAQPAVSTGSLAGLRLLKRLGISAEVGIGHSLGELAALHWAGAYDEDALLRTAAARGRAMADLGAPTGSMAGIGADADAVAALIEGEAVALAGLNSHRQTVISGEKEAVANVVARARDRGYRATLLPVSHAFHSPLVAAAVPALREHLESEPMESLSKRVVSTITGTVLDPDADLRTLLCTQVTEPVRFTEAFAAADTDVDLWLEVGPGSVLGDLAREATEKPVFSLDAGGSSLKPLLQAVAAAFALGAPLQHGALFAGRFVRPFDLDRQPRFFVNPCELAPRLSDSGYTIAAQIAEMMPQEEAPVPVVTERSGDASVLDTVRNLVAARAELPAGAVRDSDRLLSDLHLNSITVSQLVLEACRRLQVPPSAAPTEYADATVAQIAEALEELVRTGVTVEEVEKKRVPAGVDGWVRAFRSRFEEAPLSGRPTTGPGTWKVFAPEAHPLAGTLAEALAETGRRGVALVLTSDPEAEVTRMLEAAQAAIAEGKASCFLVIHPGTGAALARTLHLERPDIDVCALELPPSHPQALEWIAAEVARASGYVEARYDAEGVRSQPVIRAAELEPASESLPLGPLDVLLVTGGGKGIGAECALALARETGVRLALLGRSAPESDEELRANLDRMTAGGVRCGYYRADVTDGDAVRAAVLQAEAELGTVTAVAHAAGFNIPKLITQLDEASFRRTLAPKVRGLRNVLSAVQPERVRLLVSFGSIIGRIGMKGNADYAVANEWLTRLTQEWGETHSHCRVLSLEWSVWSGVGMGERLGASETLQQQGVTPIPLDEGIRQFLDLLRRPLTDHALVIAGRFGEPPTARMDVPELPLRRFLERSRVHYPGVELVVDVDLSCTTDPYLVDHTFGGERLLPAVVGLEAMAQVAMALTGATQAPRFEGGIFSRPVVAPGSDSVTLRLAALQVAPGRVEVVLRSEETSFQADHFRVTCVFDGEAAGIGAAPSILDATLAERPWVELDPERDLYGGILFHSGRFRRLKCYRWLRAKECIAEILPGKDGWFGRYLPTELALGDPGARDTVIHGIQACIPHATVLPIGVERITPGTVPLQGPVQVWAKERSRSGDVLVYDLEVVNSEGRVCERWEGLRLQLVRRRQASANWPAALLATYLERRLEELVPGAELRVGVHSHGGDPAQRRDRTDHILCQLLGQEARITRRVDGKPEANGWGSVSSSHTDRLTVAVAGRGPVACDAEPVVERPVSVWQDLLGPERYALAGIIAREGGENLTSAATRVWTAAECLKKAGAAGAAPLTLTSIGNDTWTLLKSGDLTAASCTVQVAGAEEPVAITLMVGSTGTAHDEPLLVSGTSTQNV